MNLTLTTFVLIGSAVGIGGLIIGYLLRWLVLLAQKSSMELTIKQKILEAREEAERITSEADKKAQSTLNEVRVLEKEKVGELKRTEERLLKKDELLDKRQGDIDREAELLKEKIVEIREIKNNVEKSKVDAEKRLSEIAGLNEEQAKEALLKTISERYQEDLVVRMQKLEIEGAERLEGKARDILATSIQRLSNSTASEMMTTTVQIPSDDSKGKIIGKEGRNIRAFERASGVEVVIDDTPGIVTLSSFDPVRRQVARVALENLIKDGRIQPARIEEMVKKAQEDVEKIMKEKAEAAAIETNVFNLDPRLLKILGRLHFRTSYGQNVLQHSIEMAHIAGMLAEEIGADATVARAGALLHDIGKAIDHEVQGTHVEIGRRILQKFNVDNRVVQAMQSHHEEYPYETLESIIVQSADAISGGRPGARRDSVENYLKRLSDLEDIANSFPGVEKTYAIQAGREIRIFVRPEEISDLDAKKMAQEIARRVEQELKYPGEIKVNVIRESRTIEYAR
ncbi:MAG TPA: ribonuclease Y [Candidatus Paceibacterota bacterium]